MTNVVNLAEYKAKKQNKQQNSIIVVLTAEEIFADALIRNKMVKARLERERANANKNITNGLKNDKNK